MNNARVVFPLLISLLTACGGGAGGTTPDAFPVDEALSTQLVGLGMAADMARFFAGVRSSSRCSSTNSCTELYTYPNGATRQLTFTASTGQQYTPTADELASTASIINPVYDRKYAGSGIDDSTPPVDAHINISYFAPDSSVPRGLKIETGKGLAPTHAAGAGGGIRIDLVEVGSKGADVAIGSLLEHYAELSTSVKTTGSVYAAASALSDISTAMSISKEVSAWLAELAALEKCAADPTNPATQTDPTYSSRTVASLRSVRAELERISAVRFLNVVDETGAGIHPATAVLSIPLKQAFVWSEQTLKAASEQLMHDARSSVVSCAPSCPTSLTATGVSESQIDLSWSGSIGSAVVTAYLIEGGHAGGASTTATTWSDTGLARSTTYCYTVSAHNDYGSAEGCPQACGTTFGPPVVHSTGPINGAAKVSVRAIVTATFSEAVDPTTVTTGTFTLTSASGAVSGAVTYSGTTATFTPAADLAYATTYTATVTTGVKDLDAVAMEANHAWTFTTEPAPVAGNLQFDLNLNGAVLATGSARVTWTKFEDLGDVRRYVPSGTITADITIQDCVPLVGVTVPIQATVPGGAGPTLVVYTASNAAFPKSYQFSMAADPNTILTFSCGADPNKYTISTPAPISFAVGICSTGGLVPFTDEAVLASSYSCLEAGLVSSSWDFSK